MSTLLTDTLISNNPAMAILAMVVACLLPFIFAIIAKATAGFTAKDNANPRELLNKATGISARANAAQQNSFETLPMFLAAIVLCMYLFVPQSFVNTLAWLYVLIRIIYGIAYLMNLALFRSIVWALSMACIFQLFYVAFKVAS